MAAHSRGAFVRRWSLRLIWSATLVFATIVIGGALDATRRLPDLQPWHRIVPSEAGTRTLTNTSTHKLPRATNSSINAVEHDPDPGSKQKDVRQNSGYESLQANEKTLKENAPKMRAAETRSQALRENLYLGKSVLKPTTNIQHPPFIIARVSKKIIPNHNTIDRDTFMHALIEFLLTLAPDERIPDPTRTPVK